MAAMSLPHWNTHSYFMTESTRDMGTVESLRLDGKMRFFSVVRPENVETLDLDLQVHVSPLPLRCRRET